MPIHVTPYYNCEGPEINVGEFSGKLSTDSVEELRATISKMQECWTDLSVETMYAASIRLYDLALKDEAVYWFYSAQYRSRLFQSVLDPTKIGNIGSSTFERQQAYNAFQQLVGEYINGYAFGDLDKLRKTIEQVKREGKVLPDFGSVYPGVSFIPEDKWGKKNNEVALGLSSLADHIENNAEEIKAMRKKNDIEGRY